MSVSRNKITNIVKYTFIIVSLYIVLKLLLIPLITSDQFKLFTASLGIFGYLVVIGYTVLSHVFAPLAGTPGVLLGVTIYGVKTGMILLYISSLVSAAINFLISRKYGRSLVIKLVGNESMKEVDEFASIEGKRVLWVSRLFGFPIFEFISYAAGLTNIPFKEYMVITAVAHSASSFMGYLVFRNIDLQSEKGIMIWIVSIVVIGAIFSYFIKSYLKTRKLRKG